MLDARSQTALSFPAHLRRPVVVALSAIALLGLAAVAGLDVTSVLMLALAGAVGGGVGWMASQGRIEATTAQGRDERARTPTAELVLLIRALEVAALAIDGARRVRAHNKLARELFPNLAEGQPLALVSRNPELTRALERAIATGRPQTAEMVERLPFGRRLLVTISPLIDAAPDAPDAPNARSLLIQFRDIGEQDRLAQMRTDFIANASHELRTPLASIKGFIETLQGPARADDAARLRFLGIMEAQAGRMNRILDDLLSLSRIEMRAHLRPETPVEIVETVRDSLRGLEPLAREAQITLKLFPNDGPRWVQGDRDELEQVFQNLVHNAIKYGRAGGRVEIAVLDRNDPVNGHRMVEVQVADDGPGIANEHLPRLTERFYRVDTARSRERGGTGLGLAIVKHILNRHRGDLEISSEVGRGSTFAVMLDVIPAPEPHREDADEIAVTEPSQ
ncbi:MAG: ATP-binding protein [Hyphomicrobium sp.]|nr:ATP-binding protein [Hyphomicrobium sp.]